MTTTQKVFWSGVVVLSILGGLAWFGWTPFLNQIINNNSTTEQVAGSPAGSSFNTAKAATQIVSVSSSTVFTLPNTDASDRTIEGAEIFLTAGNSTSTTYTVACATSSNTGTVGSNKILQVSIVGGAANTEGYGTTTSGVYIATSSPGMTGTSSPATSGYLIRTGTNAFARQWTAGSNLVCGLTTTSGSASNLFDSAITGFIKFPYQGN